MSAGLFTISSLVGAVISGDREHRYWLWRVWTRSLPILVVCMFNPSEADERKDDHTIRRLCEFAQRWGYGGILVVNLFSYRSSSPQDCRAHDKAAWGDAQPDALGHAIGLAVEQGTPILVAWGNLASSHDVEPFRQAAEGVELICLGRTGDGAPTHPAARGRHRIPSDAQPQPFKFAA